MINSYYINVEFWERIGRSMLPSEHGTRIRVQRGHLKERARYTRDRI